MTTTFRTQSRRHHDPHPTSYPHPDYLDGYLDDPALPSTEPNSGPNGMPEAAGTAGMPKAAEAVDPAEAVGPAGVVVSTGAGITATALQLKLLVTSPTTPMRRTNDGFYSTPAKVALSGNLRAGFCCGNYLLSHEALGNLGLGIRDAWNQAAANMLNHDSDHQGVAVQTRPLSCLAGRHLPGIQIRFAHSAPTAWLAHPQLFATLFHHLSRILGEEACFYAPSSGILIAEGLSADRIGVETWLAEELHPRLACRIYYRCGFPTTRGGHGGLPHEGLLSSHYMAELHAQRRAHQRTRRHDLAGYGTFGEPYDDYVTQADYDEQDHRRAA